MKCHLLGDFFIFVKNRYSESSMNFSDFLKDQSIINQKLFTKLHNLLMEIDPDYETKKVWGGWGYKRGNNYSCLAVPYKDHIKLMIWRGIDIDVHTELLEGKGVNTRHIKYFNVDQIKKEPLEAILSEQFKMYDSGIRYE